MKKFLFPLIAVISFTACSDNNQTSDHSTTADSSAAVAAIMKNDVDWSKVSEAKSADGWLAFYADDAMMMPPGGALCKDKASRETSIKGMFATPGMSLKFQTTKAEVSHSGDLGYAVGVYQWVSKDPKGADYHE